MATFYMDDHFPEHPKAQAAGDEACWLYVCGLAYIRRNRTQGVIPKPVVPRLVAKRGEALARRLVTAGLWHDDGDSYSVHDYAEFNARSLAKQAQTSEAAKKRWSKARASHEDPEDDASGDANALPPHSAEQSERSADASPRYPENHRTNEPRLSSSVVTLDPVAESSSDDDDWQDIVEAAVDILARRDLAARIAAKGTVGAVEPWLLTARMTRRLKHQAELALSDLEGFTTPQQIADWLEPPAPPKPPDPYELRQRAEREKADLEETRRTNPCAAGCDRGRIITDDGTVAICPACQGRGVAA